MCAGDVIVGPGFSLPEDPFSVSASSIGGECKGGGLGGACEECYRGPGVSVPKDPFSVSASSIGVECQVYRSLDVVPILSYIYIFRCRSNTYIHLHT